MTWHPTSLAATLLAVAACGGTPRPPAPAPASQPTTGAAERAQPNAVPSIPTTAVSAGDCVPAIEVQGTVQGRALHVRIVAEVSGLPAESAYERADQWEVRARVGEQELDRILNGSTRVERLGTRDPERWDVVVSFDTAFRLPDQQLDGQPQITVTAPGSAPDTFTIAARTAAAPANHRASISLRQ